MIKTLPSLLLIATTLFCVNTSQATEVMTLLDKLEQDDDVQNVYHTLA